ncbi:sugar phosphate isomerase/epimerase family protein [Ruegeria halocynthiae]|uniref:sugar phosphate isomerase/epimerase family protein n=1 Tax=Ruegeria halocynthiae TaxID=985054 RepID=UPI0009DC9B14|nr:sugar phosphate isomerase/epimerase [Ruegeria halocynthiae]
MRISAQLYTVRQVGDLAAQLDLVGACGFADIETIGFHGLSPNDMARQIRRSGLKARSAHFDWPEFETRFFDILDLLDQLECQMAVMPWLTPEARPDTAEGWMAVSGQLARWAEGLAAYDVRLAYHNHDFDLAGRPGQTPLDLILSHDHLHWQPDIGWLAVSQPDPAVLLQRYADRIVSVHAKDADPSAGQGDARWRAVGRGVVDWAVVLQILANSPCADLFVEHDETRTPSDTLRAGREFLLDSCLAGVG